MIRRSLGQNIRGRDTEIAPTEEGGEGRDSEIAPTEEGGEGRDSEIARTEYKGCCAGV